MRIKTSLPRIVNTLLLLAIAAVSTYWYLQWPATRTQTEHLVAISEGDPVALTQPLDVTAAASLFGANASATQSAVRLVGVIAEGGKGKGVALIAVDGQPVLAFKAGESINSELTLAEVRSDRVLIASASSMLEIRMPDVPAPSGIEPVP